MRRFLSIFLIVIATGCAARSPIDRGHVSRTLEERTGHPLDPGLKPGETRWPPGVALHDGLTEDEAVAIALWNNARFRADLTDLAAARAGLIEAGLLPNPLFSYLHLFGVKGTESYILWPIDALLQRPKKVAMAKFEVERVALRLVREGLDLTRDTIIAFADLVFAQTSAKIVEEEARIHEEIADIAAARLRAGDASGLEESVARAQALSYRDAALIASEDALIAKIRLAAILGWSDPPPDLTLTPGSELLSTELSLTELLAAAYASHLDLRAAQLDIETAGARLGWERSKILKLTATLESKEKGDLGAFLGPSAKLEIPIFNRNEGGQARARAEMEKAALNYVAVRQRIALEVNEAFNRLLAARQSLALLRAQAVPAAADALAKARKAYAAGAESYLFVLEAERQWLDIRLRETKAAANARRVDAELRRGVGSFFGVQDKGTSGK